MKNLACILVLVFAITLTTQAQRNKDHKRPQFSLEQQTNLTVKEMTLALDLSEKQQSQIAPIMKEQVAEKKAMMQKRKAVKEANKKSSSDEIYAMKIKQLDHKILLKNKMKNILTKKQFEKFEKMHKGRKMKGRKMKGRKMAKKKMKMKKAEKLQEGNN